MSDLESLIIGELLRSGPGMLGGKIRVSDSIRDGIVLVERKVWTWQEGRHARTHQQDTWWYGTSTYDRRTGGEVLHLGHVTERHGRSPHPSFTPIRTEAVGPVEIPRAYSDGSPTHAHWRIVEGGPIAMRVGHLEVDITAFLNEAPWYVDAINSAK